MFTGKRDISRCLRLVEEDRAITSPAAKLPYYPLVVKRGRGATVEDVDGNTYIDFLASAGAVNTDTAIRKLWRRSGSKQRISSFIHMSICTMNLSSS